MAFYNLYDVLRIFHKKQRVAQERIDLSVSNLDVSFLKDISNISVFHARYDYISL